MRVKKNKAGKKVENGYFDDNFFTRWIKSLSIPKKFYVIISLIIFLLVFGIAIFCLGITIMSGMRAYVGGESILSKAHKEAVVDLLRYSNSYKESDYREFTTNMSILSDSREIRLEFAKQKPDLYLIKQKLIGIGVNSQDADDMIFLYRRASWTSYMKNAVEVWAGGGDKALELDSIGASMHNIISSGNVYDSAGRAGISAKLSPYLNEIYLVDGQLTSVENNFSVILGEGSRQIKDILIVVFVALNIFLGAIVIYISISIEKITARLDVAKSEFISLASHQLRTPPTSIKWLLEMLLSGDVGSLNQKQKEYAEEIYKNNQRMITMANLLLNSSKMELGTISIAREKLDVADIAQLVLKEYEFEMKEKNITWNEKNEPGLPVGVGDAKLLRIVFENIIFNAIKYTPQGGHIGVGVSLKGRWEDAGGGRQMSEKNLVIAISDNGYGIPEEEYDLIFTKLFRASNIKEKDTDGTGLGLYLSKLILNRMGGDIWFESRIGHGTVFYMSVPVEK